MNSKKKFETAKAKGLVLRNATHYATSDLKRVILRTLREEGELGRTYRVDVVYARNNYGCSGEAYVGGNWMKVRVPASKEVVVERTHRECRACGSAWTVVDEFHPNDEVVDIGAGESESIRACPSCGAKNAPAKATKTADGVRYDYGYDFRTATKAEIDRLRPVVCTGGKRRRVALDELSPRVILDLARVVLHEAEHCRGLQHEGMCDSYKRAGEARGGGIPCPWVEGMEVRSKRLLAEPPPPIEERRSALVEAREKRARDLLAKWESTLERSKRKVVKYRRIVKGYERRAAAKGGGR